MLKANDPSSNMDSVHHMDELNSKDTLISDLKYQLEKATKGNKEWNLEIAMLKRSNNELIEGLQKQTDITLQKEKEILKIETENSSGANSEQVKKYQQ
jgi:hypothetical protein